MAGWMGLEQKIFREDDPDALLPVVHHVISNLKSFVQGTFHGVSKEHLQGYLDEFSWRYCHRADRSKFASLLSDLIAGSKLGKPQLTELLSVQPPQPDAPDWRERRAMRSAIMR